MLPCFVGLSTVANTHYGRLLAAQDGARWGLLVYFLCFIPNVALLHQHAVPGASQAWSIGVEEQFYVAWPLLMVLARRYFWGVCAIIAFAPVWEHVLGLGVDLTLFPFEALAWGALAALAWERFPERVDGMFRFGWCNAVIVVAVVACWFSPVVPYRIARAAVFAIGVLMIIHLLRSRAEPAVLRWLGKYSYGIYMLHPMCMFIMLTVLPFPHSREFDVFVYVRDYTLTVGATLLCAYLVYRFIEQPVLILKTRFQIVRSGI
ncbi:MAG: acyltransferase family protein [Phycisphaera sp.]|nr:acyltransferase family protein [Phycisphaera sp.]